MPDVCCRGAQTRDVKNQIFACILSKWNHMCYCGVLLGNAPHESDGIENYLLMMCAKNETICSVGVD